MAGIRINVVVDAEPDLMEEEYRVDSGRRCSGDKEQECVFGMKLKHPEVGTVRNLPFAISQPMEGLVLIRTPQGMMLFNRLEHKNIRIKAGNDNFIVIQPEDHVMFTDVKMSTLNGWAVDDKGTWKSIDQSLKELFANSRQAPPSESYQLRVSLQPDVRSLRLRIGSDAAQPSQLSFDISCSKLPRNQTWYFDLKLYTIAPNILIMNEPRRTLVLNQTKNVIQLEKEKNFYFINSKGTGVFECLNPRNASGYMLHISGQKIGIAEAIKSLTRGVSSQGQ